LAAGYTYEKIRLPPVALYGIFMVLYSFQKQLRPTPNAFASRLAAL
jgi:hypothetical protein